MDLVLDIYDDPAASRLRARLGAEGVPEKVAAIPLMTTAELNVLPDRLFALVLENEGQKFRKYAMHDEGHLATSIAYFLECGDQLPEAFRSKVAANLVNACAWYETTPPEALVKVALLGAALSALALPSAMKAQKERNASDMQQLQAAQVSGVKQASGKEIQGDSWENLDRFLRGEESFEAKYDAMNTGYDNPFRKRVAEKQADLRGSEYGALSSLSTDGTTPPQKKMPSSVKVSHYALPETNTYPIESPSQVILAVSYFEKHASAFTPADRHTFAHSVCTRAKELGLDPGYQIKKLASTEYGDFIKQELASRVRAFEGTTRGSGYEVLAEKVASIPPVVMHDLLTRFDRETGIDQSYGRPVVGFMSPDDAVYGKLAAEPYSWTKGNDYVSEETLTAYAKQAPDLKKLFGEDFSRRFVTDPVSCFRGLNDDRKVILSRLANNAAYRSA